MTDEQNGNESMEKEGEGERETKAEPEQKVTKKELKQSFGKEEKSICKAYNKGSLVITDDLKFTSCIKRENIRSLSSAHLIYALVKKKKISKDNAHYCLEKLKPYIRKDLYKLIKKDVGE